MVSIEQNDGEYQLQRNISPIALLDNNVWWRECVIFCEEPGTHVCSDTCQLSFYKTNTKDLQSYFFLCMAESILCLFHFI